MVALTIKQVTSEEAVKQCHTISVKRGETQLFFADSNAYYSDMEKVHVTEKDTTGTIYDYDIDKDKLPVQVDEEITTINTDKIIHAKGQFIKAETALDGIGIKVHPGAQKYFDEVK